MPEHYTRNTNGVFRWCSSCNRLTMHDVDDRRVSSCREIHVTGMSKAQEKREDRNEKKLQELF